MTTILVQATGARRAIEVGTFLGYGAVAIARGLPADGELVICELEQRYADRARAHLKLAGLDGLGPTSGSAPRSRACRAIEEDGSFDLAFVDADKGELPRLLRGVPAAAAPGRPDASRQRLHAPGRILDPPDDQSEVMAKLNARIAADDRVEVAMLAVADGISLVRKR